MKKIIIVFLLAVMMSVPVGAQSYSKTHEQKYYCGNEYGKVRCMAVYSTTDNVRWTYAWNSLTVTCKAISAIKTYENVCDTRLRTKANVLVTSYANSTSSSNPQWQFTYSNGSITWSTFQ